MSVVYTRGADCHIVTTWKFWDLKFKITLAELKLSKKMLWILSHSCNYSILIFLHKDRGRVQMLKVVFPKKIRIRLEQKWTRIKFLNLRKSIILTGLKIQQNVRIFIISKCPLFIKNMKEFSKFDFSKITCGMPVAQKTADFCKYSRISIKLKTYQGVKFDLLCHIVWLLAELAE